MNFRCPFCKVGCDRWSEMIAHVDDRHGYAPMPSLDWLKREADRLANPKALSAHDICDLIHHHPFSEVVKIVTGALEDIRVKAAADMRERCAKIAEDTIDGYGGTGGVGTGIAVEIRALPLEPK